MKAIGITPSAMLCLSAIDVRQRAILARSAAHEFNPHSAGRNEEIRPFSTPRRAGLYHNATGLYWYDMTCCARGNRWFLSECSEGEGLAWLPDLGSNQGPAD